MKIFLISNLIIVFFFFQKENRNLSITSPQATTHKVGEHFGGGIVFYVDATGQHGLIAAPSDQKKFKWYNGSFIVTNATGTAIGTGQANTKTIIAAQGPGTYAASECDKLELNGFDDWFLPSKDELNLMRSKKMMIGGFESPGYWSSTEYSSLYAWGQNFNNGFQNYGNKNSLPSVRAIRAF